MSVERFNKCLDFLLKREGGISDVKEDRGGLTNHGVTQKRYDEYRFALSLPLQPVVCITLQEVAKFYWSEYWTPVKSNYVMPPLDLVLFDTAVIAGVRQSSKFLQRALHINEGFVDGVIGKGTLAALNQASINGHADEVWNNIIAQRIAFHKKDVMDHPPQAKFLAGWLNRCALLQKECEAIQKAQS